MERLATKLVCHAPVGIIDEVIFKWESVRFALIEWQDESKPDASSQGGRPLGAP